MKASWYDKTFLTSSPAYVSLKVRKLVKRINPITSIIDYLDVYKVSGFKQGKMYDISRWHFIRMFYSSLKHFFLLPV